VVVDLAVDEDVRVRVRGDGEVALADELADLRPGLALVMEERDASMAQVVRRRGRASAG
jgi:hypothetical protein